MTTNDQLLILADNMTRVDLLRGVVRLAQDGWSPAVAGPRRSELGGASAWDDVSETLELESIFGASDNPGEVWRQIARLLEQAERYANGEPGVSPVVLMARPEGSRLTAGLFYAALVTGGRVPQLSKQYMRMLGSGALPPARVEIRRRGAWTVAAAGAPTTDVPADIEAGMEEVSPLTGATASQEQYTAAWASSHEDLSPVSLAIYPDTGTFSITGLQQVGAIVAPSSGSISVVNAESLSPGSGGYSSQAGMNARNTNYLRFVPPNSTAAGTLTNTSISATSFTAYLVCQAVTQPFEVYLEFWRESGSAVGTSFYSGTVTIPVGAPRLVSLGYCASPVLISRMKLWCRSPNGTTGSPELRVDTLILVIDGDRPHYAIVADYGGMTFANQSLLVLRHAPVPLDTGHRDGPIAAATQFAAGPFTALLWSMPSVMGDLAVHSKQDAMIVFPFVLSSTSFRADVAAGISLSLAARRYPAYLVME